MRRLRVLVAEGPAVARALADAGCEVVLIAADATATMIAATATQEAVDAIATRDVAGVTALVDAGVEVLDGAGALARFTATRIA